MNKLYAFLVITFFVFNGHAQIINIPDANFKARLLAASPSNQIALNGLVAIKIDANDNNEIEVSEALQVSGLNVAIANIYDLTGIEAFNNLRSFNCTQNHIADLPLSTLPNLKSLYCSLNLLTSLNLSGLTHLLNLECAENTLTQIDFADATSLQTLSCRFNFLTTLEINELDNLLSLNCDYNQLLVLEVGNLTQLTDLSCQSNQFTTLELSGLVTLNSLNCSYNQLSALNLNGLDALTDLDCSHNQITSLDTANLLHLSLLNAESNQINTPIILNGMADLQSVYCQNNLIPSITFTDLPNLQVLDCSNNQLSDLDASGLSQLSLLNCHDNTQLVHLNIQNDSNEQFLDFSGNPNLLTICVDEEQLATVQNLITQYGYTNCQADALCNLGEPDRGLDTVFSLAPVPTKNMLTITAKQNMPITSASIYNTLGQLVQVNTHPGETIDVSGLKTGSYIIRILSDKGTTIGKFIKE